jgi:hypothetical protein
VLPFMWLEGAYLIRVTHLEGSAGLERAGFPNLIQADFGGSIPSRRNG